MFNFVVSHGSVGNTHFVHPIFFKLWFLLYWRLRLENWQPSQQQPLWRFFVVTGVGDILFPCVSIVVSDNLFCSVCAIWLTFVLCECLSNSTNWHKISFGHHNITSEGINCYVRRRLSVLVSIPQRVHAFERREQYESAYERAEPVSAAEPAG